MLLGPQQWKSKKNKVETQSKNKAKPLDKVWETSKTAS